MGMRGGGRVVAFAVCPLVLALGCASKKNPVEGLPISPTTPQLPTDNSTTPPQPPPPPPPPVQGNAGRWGDVINWPVNPTHVMLLPSGLVMFVGEFLDGAKPPELWDPSTGTLSQAAYAGFNVFCSGHTFLRDGSLLFAGGHLDNDFGLPFASIYDPAANAWTRLPDMNAGRWYATNTSLANGDVVVVSGETAGVGDINPIPQVWDTTNKAWRTLTSAWKQVPLYPRMFAAPNGKVFVAGPDSLSSWLDPSGLGAWTDGPRSANGFRDYGSAVMLDGKVLVMGGGNPPTNTAEMIDLDAATPTWAPRASMAFPRRHLNATILPDGNVLVTGGSSGAGFNNDTAPVLAAEIYDPERDTWTTLSSMTGFHGYHSTALLLPDGRVVAGGTRAPDIGNDSVQVFSPPYLFKGPQPTVSSAPGTVAAGSSFFVGTPDADRIVRVSLIRFGAVTHAFNMNQRYVTLSFSQTPGGLTVSAPPSYDRAPPGHYLLFLVDANGVPSVGQVVRLDG